MHGVSGSLKHGELTAIMGPSGSGKTTFLNLMAGKVDRTEGSIKINGEEGELTRYRKVIGFVPQEDVMLRNMTVEDNVRHSALMRLPTDLSREEKLLHVDDTLDSLEISHVRDSCWGQEPSWNQWLTAQARQHCTRDGHEAQPSVSRRAHERA